MAAKNPPVPPDVTALIGDHPDTVNRWGVMMKGKPKGGMGLSKADALKKIQGEITSGALQSNAPGLGAPPVVVNPVNPPPPASATAVEESPAEKTDEEEGEDEDLPLQVDPPILSPVVAPVPATPVTTKKARKPAGPPPAPITSPGYGSPLRDPPAGTTGYQQTEAALGDSGSVLTSTTNPMFPTGRANPQVLRSQAGTAQGFVADPPTPLSPGTDLEISMTLLDQLSYVGFDTVLTREEVRRVCSFKDLVRLCAIYIRVGNNAGKRLAGKKVKDADAATEAKDLLRELEIKKTARGSSGLTLPRIMQCCAPVLLAVRHEGSRRGLLEARIETTSILEFQDLAFSGLYDEAADYCIKFGRLLGKAAAVSTKQTYDEAATDERNKGFVSVARQGLSKDSELATGLTIRDWDSAKEWFLGWSESV